MKGDKTWDQSWTSGDPQAELEMTPGQILNSKTVETISRARKLTQSRAQLLAQPSSNRLRFDYERLKDLVFIEETVGGRWQKFYHVIFVTSKVLQGDCFGSVVWKIKLRGGNGSRND